MRFGEPRLLSNTRKALQAGEFARDIGKFDLFHERVFQACFVEGQNIGEMQVLLEIGREVGLDVEKLQEAIAKEEYKPVLEKARSEWSKLGTTGIPTFVINESTVIVGAQPIEEFRKVLVK